MPGDRWNPPTPGRQTHGGWGLFESGLVAESVEPADPSSEFAQSNPMGEDFNYAEEFKKLDLDALKKDIRS